MEMAASKIDRAYCPRLLAIQSVDRVYVVPRPLASINTGT